jgi:hypothetical protein
VTSERRRLRARKGFEPAVTVGCGSSDERSDVGAPASLVSGSGGYVVNGGVRYPGAARRQHGADARSGDTGSNLDRAASPLSAKLLEAPSEPRRSGAAMGASRNTGSGTTERSGVRSAAVVAS